MNHNDLKVIRIVYSRHGDTWILADMSYSSGVTDLLGEDRPLFDPDQRQPDHHLNAIRRLVASKHLNNGNDFQDIAEDLWIVTLYLKRDPVTSKAEAKELREKEILEPAPVS